MDDIDVTFCFYDDPDYVEDADGESRVLQQWHLRLWSKNVPGGERFAWVADKASTGLLDESRASTMRVSSDTIASTHSRYRAVREFWTGLSPDEQRQYERAYYTIGGFIVFPRHLESLNQVRGRDPRISDRFDLTLECIRRHYQGEASPLGDVLAHDELFFDMFGDGADGFSAYVDFFHLQDLVAGERIRWLDGFAGDGWDFSRPPLPQTPSDYRRYLDNVRDFVAARNDRIGLWVAKES